MAGAEKVVLFGTVDLDFGHLRLVLGRSAGGAMHWLLYAPGMDGPGGLSVVSGFCAGEGGVDACAAARRGRCDRGGGGRWLMG